MQPKKDQVLISM